MKRDTILFDINETVLDLSSLKPGFEKAFGEAGVLPTWFAMLLQSSTVCAITGVKTGFATLAGLARNWKRQPFGTRPRAAGSGPA